MNCHQKKNNFRYGFFTRLINFNRDETNFNFINLVIDKVY